MFAWLWLSKDLCKMENVNCSAARVILVQLSENNSTIFDSVDYSFDECNNLLVPCYGETVEVPYTESWLELDSPQVAENLLDCFAELTSQEEIAALNNADGPDYEPSFVSESDANTGEPSATTSGVRTIISKVFIELANFSAGNLFTLK